MPGWIQRNRSLLIAVNMMKRLSHQVLCGYDRSVEHIRFRWLRQSIKPSSRLSATARACDTASNTVSKMVLGAHEDSSCWWFSWQISFDTPLTGNKLEVDGWVSQGRRDPKLAMHAACCSLTGLKPSER